MGNLMVGCTVRLKSSGEICTLTQTPDSGNDVKVTVTKADGSQSGYMKWNLFDPIPAVLPAKQLRENTIETLNLGNKGLGVDGGLMLAALMAANHSTTCLHVSNCSMGTAAAKVFGDMLSENTTIKTLDVSNNGFDKPVVGDQVKLKSSGEMCSLTMAPEDNEVKVTKADGSQSSYIKWDLFEWENQFSAFCAGIASSQGLNSVSKMLALILLRCLIQNPSFPIPQLAVSGLDQSSKDELIKHKPPQLTLNI